MKYRKLDAAGDYSFGHGLGDFYVDQPEAVAQAAQTRLGLWVGDWFLDLAEGTDWQNRVLGTGTAGLYDAEIRGRIAGTPGVLQLDSYSSQRSARRGLQVSAALRTVFGPAPVLAAMVRPPGRDPHEPLLGWDGQQLLGLDGQQLTAGSPV